MTTRSEGPRRHRIARRTLLLAGAAALASRVSVAADPVVLRLGDQKGGVEALLNAAGVLHDLPYKLEISQFAAAAPLLEALNAGAVDVAWAGDAPTNFALANGTPAHIISAHRSSGAGTALLVKQDAPIHAVADLAGKQIGTGGVRSVTRWYWRRSRRMGWRSTPYR